MTPSPNQARKQNQEKALMESWTHMEKKPMEGNLYNIIAKNLPRVLQTVCSLYLQMHPSDIFVCTPYSQGFQISLLTCELGL